VQKPVTSSSGWRTNNSSTTTSRWRAGSTTTFPVAGETFRQFVKYLYQQNRLVKGTMPIGKHTVDLKAITCPVLNLMAKRDDLVRAARARRSTTW
jgi:poly(3-hydroxyalkanoate) synthetase